MRTIYEWFMELAPPKSWGEINSWIEYMELCQYTNVPSECRVHVACGLCGKKRWISKKAATRKSGGKCPTCYVYYSRIISRATGKVGLAIRRGELPNAKTLKCADCGDQAMQYDHRDYRQPLIVDPVCVPCNMKRGRGEPFISLVKHGYDDNPHLKRRKK